MERVGPVKRVGPVNRANSLARLHGSFTPRDNFKLWRGKKTRIFVFKMEFNFLGKLCLFVALTLQFQGLLYAYLAYRQHIGRCLIIYYATKRTIAHRKARHQKLKRLARKKRSRWVNQGRTDAWWSNMINEISPLEDWKKNFRMSKDQFIELCEELRPHISPGTSPNYLSLSVEKKVAVTLCYLKETGTIWMTANTFGIHQCTVSKIVLQVCSAISVHLCPKYIHLPRTEDEMRIKVAEFETKFGMVQAMGCIDGTHVPIQRPKC